MPSPADRHAKLVKVLRGLGALGGLAWAVSLIAVGGFDTPAGKTLIGIGAALMLIGAVAEIWRRRQ